MNNIWLFESILEESKDHFLDPKHKKSRVSFLDAKSLDYLRDVLKRWPDLEKKINWNKQISFSDLEEIEAIAEQRASSYKNTGKLSAIFDQEKTLSKNDYKIIDETENEIYVVPLSHSCVVFMNSFNCYGHGAKWCIGERANSKIWHDYTSKGIIFIFRYSKTQNEKFMFSIRGAGPDSHGINIEIWNAQDDKTASNVMDPKSGHVFAWEDDNGNGPEKYYGNILKNNKIKELIDKAYEVSEIQKSKREELMPELMLEHYHNFLSKQENIDSLLDSFPDQIKTAEGRREVFEIHKRYAILQACNELGVDTYKYNDYIEKYTEPFFDKFEEFVIDKLLHEHFVMEDFLRLYENKDRFIDRIQIIKDPEKKEYYKKFFRAHRNLENKVDWNLTEDFLIMDMDAVIKDNEENSRSKMKKRIEGGEIDAPFKGREDCEVIYKTKNDVWVAPLKHSAVQYMNSFDCYGSGAKWCIGQTDDKRAWNDYVFQKQNVFMFRYCAIQNEKFMIQYSSKYNPELATVIVWNAADSSIFRGKVDLEKNEVYSAEQYREDHEMFGAALSENGFFDKLTEKVCKIFEERVFQDQHYELRRKVLDYYKDYLVRYKDTFINRLIDQVKDESQWEKLFDFVTTVALGEALDKITPTLEDNHWITPAQFLKLPGIKIGSSTPPTMEAVLLLWFEVFMNDLWKENNNFQSEKLQEKKDHIIKRMGYIKDIEEKFIKFFNSHSNLESEINWNTKDKEQLRKDIEKLITKTDNSKSKIKKRTKEDLGEIWKDRDDVKVYYSSKSEIVVAPLKWEAAIFMNSFNCYGQGARWCIGDSNTDKAWLDYTQKQKTPFLFYYNSEIHKKLMIQLETAKHEDANITIYDDNDNVFLHSIKADEISGLLGTNIPFEEYFEDLEDVYRKTMIAMPDKKIMEFLGYDYTKQPHHDSLEWFIKNWWELEKDFKTKGKHIKLYYKGNNKFEIRSNGPGLILKYGEASVSRTGLQWPHLYGWRLGLSPYDVETQETGLPFSDASKEPYVDAIRCENVIIYDLMEFTYGDEAYKFPQNILGNLILKSCNISKETAEALPTNILGTVKLEDTQFVESWTFPRWKEQLINNNDVTASYPDTIPAHIYQFLKDYFYGIGQFEGMGSMSKYTIENFEADFKEVMHSWPLEKADKQEKIEGASRVARKQAREYIKDLMDMGLKNNDMVQDINRMNPETVLRIMIDFVEDVIENEMDIYE